MSKITEFVSQHKVAIGGSIAGLLVLYLLMKSSGSGTSSDAAQISAEAALAQSGQQAQLQLQQLQVQSQAVSSQQESTDAQTAASLSLGTTNSNNSLTALEAQYAVQNTANNLSAQTTQAVSLLQAQVAENTTAAQVATTQLNDAAYVDIASLPYENINAAAISQLNANTTAIQNLSSAYIDTTDSLFPQNAAGNATINYTGGIAGLPLPFNLNLVPNNTTPTSTGVNGLITTAAA